MSNLQFQKFKTKLHERRYIGPEGTKEYKKLSPKILGEEIYKHNPKKPKKKLLNLVCRILKKNTELKRNM